MEKILLKFDCHLRSDQEEHPSYRLVKKFAKSWKPDVIVDGGDFLDLNYISTYDERRARLLEGHRFRDDFDLGNRDLDFWQKLGKVVILEGNHDFRLQTLIDEQPRFEGLVGFEENFHLKERGIPFYRLMDPPLKLGKLLVIHGSIATKYTARRNLEKYKHSVVCGHVHRFEEASDSLPVLGESIRSWTIGCLSELQPDWRKGVPTDWCNGFAVMYLEKDTGRFSLYPIYIDKYYQFWWEGKKWSLS
jgi:predicted phosphodiesterase